ncbi:MAG: penicillin-insensitive murein endopeptidase [Rhodospirillum sp.]|nr:penicillin-insensitive murein endopeptidase [Rhodospirillum sp.]MCF8489807.1 penicillin-insensitive murein endopeptidase [Rhodospirillum sp.]MCF8501612.1 penicillin-insensitive murein endopeptidase [Rhodospirillum sp.]
MFQFPVGHARVVGLALSLGLASWVAKGAEPPQWPDAPFPTTGPAHAIGATNLGCLTGGMALAPDSAPLEILRPQRNRFWGHPILVATLRDLARSLDAMGHAPLLVADMGLPRGGPLPSGHRSHMNGLDADIWFRGDGPAHHDATWLATPSALSAVAPNGLEINPAVFDAGTRALLETAARDTRVDRIFVNPVLKRALCQERGGEPEAAVWLGKLRPWWGHDRHAHLRLTCPGDSPDCQVQDPIPPGTGCDASLDWWFTEDARAPKPPSGPPSVWPPQPPLACSRLSTE